MGFTELALIVGGFVGNEVVGDGLGFLGFLAVLGQLVWTGVGVKFVVVLAGSVLDGFVLEGVVID